MNKTLIELFETGGRHDFEFTYKTEDGSENVATLDLVNKKIFVSIGNPEDEDLNVILKDILKELKEFLY